MPRVVVRGINYQEAAMSERFDAIVIGTGQAGPSLAVRLAKAGRKTAIIERKRFGGTCVNNGCIPTKALIASARAAHVARTAREWGVVVPPGVAVDMRAVKARKDAIVRKSNEGITNWLKGTQGLTVIEAHARFEAPHTVRVGDRLLEAPHTVRVGDRLLEAPHIFVNVGGRAATPPLTGLGEVPYLDNVSMMEVDSLPEHLLIVGGSYIGLEFAQMYRRFGCAVTVVEMAPRLVSREDEDVSAAIMDILEGEGITVRVSATCVAVRREGDRIAMHVDCESEPREIVGTHLLLATGRRPNTDDLGCERAGIALDDRGYIVVDDELRTNVDGIFALGDVNGRGAFTHTAYNDYEIVAANLLDGESRRLADRIPTYALFIDPPLGRAGMTEREARADGRKVLAATMPMSRVGRATERGETAGFMRVLVDAGTKRILGASLLGIEGDEVIHTLLDVMYAGVPYTVIERAMHIHPTVTELIPTLLGHLKPLS
jgi:pyruvate/2-oxoglutarate dehydrogenase complex dihydrolipoamide dehydrogenase (E3) component